MLPMLQGFTLSVTVTHSNRQLSTKRVVYKILTRRMESSNHHSQKFKLANGLEMLIAEVTGIKESLNEVLSLSENTKLPIALCHIY